MGIKPGLRRIMPASIIGLLLLALLAAPLAVFAAPPQQKGGNVTPIGYGQSATGVIDAMRYEAVYSFDGQAGDVVSISLIASDTLDPYLVLYDAYPSQNPLTADDDSAGNLDSLINGYQLPASGRYYIVATRFGRETGDTVGGYTLTLDYGTVEPVTTAGLSAFECNGALVDTSAIVTFDDVRPGFTYQVTVLGLDGFDPVIALFAEDGSAICNDDELAATGSLVDVPEIGVVTADGLTAQVMFTTSGSIGDIEMNIGGFGGSGGRFIAIFEGLAIAPSNELDGVLVTTAAVPNGEDMYVYMVSQTGALDPYMSLPEWGIACDDIGSEGCMGVPGFSGGGIDIANGGTYVTGPFDAGIGIVSDGTPQYFQFASFGGQSAGNYAMVIYGAAPGVTGGATTTNVTGMTGADVFDFSTPASYGSATLSAGFAPDPYQIQLAAGGGIDANATLGPPCMGFVATVPDYRLIYTAGQYRLRMFVASSGDTTLVVNAPDGQWYCADDSGGTLNPMLDFNNPMSGQYDIWVGNFAVQDTQSATLTITETELTP